MLAGAKLIQTAQVTLLLTGSRFNRIIRVIIKGPVASLLALLV